MNLSPVYTKKIKCHDCYKCIRRCPAKAIRVENFRPTVMGSYCIACGQCIMQCPAHAKQFRNDVSFVKQILAMKSRVIVSLDSSFVSEFTEYSVSDFVSALKRLGFSEISETAIGADLISAKLSQMLMAENSCKSQKLFISSSCPAAVEYIKRYMSGYAPFITDCASPILAHARYLKQMYGHDIGVVYIGTCIARKKEADAWDEIDAAITFKELQEWFHSERIIIPSSKRKNTAADIMPFFPFRAAKGELFTIEGGMMYALGQYSLSHSARIMSVSGIENIRRTLRGLKPEDLKEPLFIEISSCSGGCINGPGTTKPLALAMKRIQVMDFAQTAAAVVDESVLKSAPDLAGTLPAAAVVQKKYSEEEMQRALHSIGKYAVNDLINCNGCGYDSCRQFAQAMLNGVAEKTMCVAYTRNLAQKKANALVNAIPSGVVIADKNLNIIESNKNFACLMGSKALDVFEKTSDLEGVNLSAVSQHAALFSDVLSSSGPDVIDREVHEGKRIMHYTVFAIEKEEIVAGVIEDITTPQNQKQRTITQARNVIEKNLSAVQKIAFLLGENAAETEAILNSIIESYGDDET